MTTHSKSESSTWPTITAYSQRFGKIPAQVGKFLANSANPETFPKFEEMLKAQLAKDEPVADGEEFLKPLLRHR